VFEVSIERQAVKETNIGVPAGSMGAVILPTIAVCDVDLIHQSHISDEEELRFQMGVAVYGTERNGVRLRGADGDPSHPRRAAKPGAGGLEPTGQPG
jgi:hypothetical protein